MTTALPRQRILELVHGRYIAKAIHIATKRKIADIVTLNGNAVNCEEIATKLNCNSTNLYRLMSYLSAHGIFEEKEGRCFVGNSMSEALRECSQENCYFGVLMFGSDAQWQGIMQMESVLDKQSSKTPFQLGNGATLFDFLAENPEDRRNYDLAVVGLMQSWQSDVPKIVDFSEFASVVDLAGGYGHLLKAILSENSKIEGTLFELPAVVEGLSRDLKKLPFQVVEGDLFKSVDCSGDLFTIAMTLHLFTDDDVLVALSNIARAMRRRPRSRLLLLEMDYDKCNPNEPSEIRQFDMAVMLNSGGQERPLSAWIKLLHRSGIKVLKKHVVPPLFMGIECEIAP